MLQDVVKDGTYFQTSDKWYTRSDSEGTSCSSEGNKFQ